MLNIAVIEDIKSEKTFRRHKGQSYVPNAKLGNPLSTTLKKIVFKNVRLLNGAQIYFADSLMIGKIINTIGDPQIRASYFEYNFSANFGFFQDVMNQSWQQQVRGSSELKGLVN